MAEEVEPCDEFTYFPLLPCEIRLKIWKLSITPRLLPSPPAPGLLVSHEARDIYLKAHSPCFSRHLGKRRNPISFPLSSQANFAHDILFFGQFKESCTWHKYEAWSQHFSIYLVEGAEDKIQHLAIRYFFNFGGRELEDRLLEIKGLKTLTIAVDDTDYSKWDREEHWSLYQQVDWNSPLQELQVMQGDDLWGYKNDIHQSLLKMEQYYPWYKAPKLKFARINYTYGDLGDCWADDDDDDDLEAMDRSVSPLIFPSSAKDKKGDSSPVERNMGLSASYSKCCFDSILMEESLKGANATI
jgi:hypothetical protein